MVGICKGETIQGELGELYLDMYTDGRIVATLEPYETYESVRARRLSLNWHDFNVYTTMGMLPQTGDAVYDAETEELWRAGLNKLN